MEKDKLVHREKKYNLNSVYVAGTEVNLQHKALEIYVSGCLNHDCKGCHNPELWYWNVGQRWECVRDEVLKKIVEGSTSGLIDSIWILGGEPCDQHFNFFQDMLQELRETGLKMVLWTHYLPDNSEPNYPEYIPYKKYFDYVKVGPYVAGGEAYTEPVLGIELANREQYVITVPEEQKISLAWDPPLSLVDDPMELLIYLTDPLDWIEKHPDVDITPYAESERRYNRYSGIYFGSAGRVMEIEHHPDLCVPDIMLVSDKSANYFLSDYIPLHLREAFLAGRMVEVNQGIAELQRRLES